MKTELSEYEQQAIDFLTLTNTGLTVVFKEFNSMSWDKDGQKRNIFTVTLENTRHKYSFDFGSSLADSLKQTPIIYSKESKEIYYGITHRLFSLSFKIKTSYPELLKIKDTKDYDSIINEAELTAVWEQCCQDVEKHNKKYRWQSFKPIEFEHLKHRIKERIATVIKEAETQTTLLEQADSIVPPTAYDVLAAVTKYDTGTFENFCSDFGYDSDSRNAMKTYKAVRKEFNNLSKLFTESELEQLQEIQ